MWAAGDTSPMVNLHTSMRASERERQKPFTFMAHMCVIVVRVAQLNWMGIIMISSRSDQLSRSLSAVRFSGWNARGDRRVSMPLTCLQFSVVTATRTHFKHSSLLLCSAFHRKKTCLRKKLADGVSHTHRHTVRWACVGVKVLLLFPIH
jgi:hypothetical protein